jgi:hypothetical protein
MALGQGAYLVIEFFDSSLQRQQAADFKGVVA